MPIRSLPLVGGMATPVLYFALLFSAGAFYPDFSHVRQVASELGTDGAPYGGGAAFNLALVIIGFIGTTAAVGLVAALRRAGARTLLALLTGVTYAGPFINLMMSGLWPLPHSWHSSVTLVLAGFFAPGIAVLALRPVADTRPLKIALATSFVLILVVFNGLGGLNTPELAGLRWRLIALFLMGSFALLCGTLHMRLKSK